MRIRTVEIHPIEIPLRYRQQLSFAAVDSVKNVLLAIRTDEGIVGWGETAPLPGFGGESQESIVASLQHYLCPALLGRDPFDLEAIMADAARRVARSPFALTAIDFALHDLMGKALNVPLYKLLGGRFTHPLPLGWSMGIKPPDALAKEAEWALASGLRALKLKIGSPDPREDLARLRLLREVAGPDVPLRVDANAGLERAEALPLLRRMEEFSLQMIEQPIAGWDLEGMAELTRALDTPVMADESLYGVQEALAIVRCQAADILNIKPQKAGGLLGSRKIAAVAEGANLHTFASCFKSTSVGTTASAHLACAMPTMRYEAEFAYGIQILQADVVVEQPTIRNGLFHLPPGPGIGVEIDPERLSRIAVGSPIVLEEKRVVG